MRATYSFHSVPCCCLLVALLIQNATAQTGQESDLDSAAAVHSYTFGEVVVTALRAPIENTWSPSRICSISRQELQKFAGTSLGELIVGTPGLMVRQYGGGGSLQTASFRGMSAEHTAVLLDGIPVGNMQTGVSDLRLIPLDYVERIEMMRGGSSAQYGSDAVGGVINILTAPLCGNPFVHIDASAGSFGARRLGVSAEVWSQKDLACVLGGTTDYGRGNHPFSILQGLNLIDAERANSDYSMHHLFARGRWHVGGNTQSSFLVSSLTSERGTPGPVLAVSDQGTARQTDTQLHVLASVQTDLRDACRISSSLSFQNAYERYLDHSGSFPADNYYRNSLLSFSSSVRSMVGPSVVLHWGADWSVARAEGNALPNEKWRTQVGLRAGGEVHAVTPVFRVSFYPSARVDHYSATGDALSPKLGLNARCDLGSAGPLTMVGATLHATIGRDFRAPTFNELYYTGAGGHGNEALEPERSTCADVGLTLVWTLLGRHELDATYYTIATNDRIQWLPTAVATMWSPVNIGRTRSSGIELEYRWSPVPEYVSVEANYVTIDARKDPRGGAYDPADGKQLLFIPLETANAAAELDIPIHQGILSGVFVRVSDSMTGKRFITEDNAESLPRYHFVSGNAGVTGDVLGSTVTLSYEVLNALATPYEIIPRYPMALRSHTVRFSLQHPF